MEREHRSAAETARDLARAGAVIARDLAGTVTAREKADGSGPVTEADLQLQEHFSAGLRRRFPADVILGEESRERVDLAAARLWCVDPLDGTREYADGRDEYAVMAGLLENGEPVAGALAVPACRLVVWGWRGGGAFIEQDGAVRTVQLSDLADLGRATVIHSRSHRNAALEEALRRLRPASTLAAGSVGYKVAQILLGHAHLYVHTGKGTKWWDSVAPAAVLLAAGGCVADARGRPLRYRGRVRHDEGLLFTAPGLLAPTAKRLRRS